MVVDNTLKISNSHIIKLRHTELLKKIIMPSTRITGLEVRSNAKDHHFSVEKVC